MITAFILAMSLCACNLTFEAGEDGYMSTTHEYEQTPSGTVSTTETTSNQSSEPSTSETESEEKTVDTVIEWEDVVAEGRDIKVFGDIDEDLSEIETALDGYGQKISVLAYSLDGKKAIAYNTNQKYFSACTIKAGYVLSCCKQIDQGTYNADDVMTYESKHYHTGSGKIKNQPYGTKYSIKTLLHEALYISDNVAYEMLVDYFGHEYYNKMIKKLGCTGLELKGLWSHNVTVNDLGILWSEIATYLESDSTMSETLRKACTNSPYNYGSQFTTDVDYSHKSGDNFGDYAAYNDAGIMWGETPYVYVVLTNSEGGATTKNVINKTMSKIFDIMQSSDEENL